MIQWSALCFTRNISAFIQTFRTFTKAYMKLEVKNPNEE
jgi:hypothetical protein